MTTHGEQNPVTEPTSDHLPDEAIPAHEGTVDLRRPRVEAGVAGSAISPDPADRGVPSGLAQKRSCVVGWERNAYHGPAGRQRAGSTHSLAALTR